MDVVTQIVEELILREDQGSTQFVTRTAEEYDLLFHAVLNGSLTGRVDLGRSGIWLNKMRVSPPSEYVTE